MEHEQNAGYQLKDGIFLKGSSYVLGHNPNAPSPFVTWEKVKDGYWQGHYFTSEADARLDLLQRAAGSLPQPEVDQLALAILSDEQKDILIQKSREEEAMADIESCLCGVAADLEMEDAAVKQLLNDSIFQSEALRTYHEQNHSAENEALSDALQKMVQTLFPEYLPTPIQKPSLDHQIQTALKQQTETAEVSPKRNHPQHAERKERDEYA